MLEVKPDDKLPKASKVSNQLRESKRAWRFEGFETGIPRPENRGAGIPMMVERSLFTKRDGAGRKARDGIVRRKLASRMTSILTT